MKFWKFEYEGPEALADCIKNRALPSANRAFPGLENTHPYPTKAMKVGDGIVLAKLYGDEGRIFAVGIIRQVESYETPAVVDWAATKKTVFPNARGGLTNWQRKSAFEISPEPAKRYGLMLLIEYYFRDIEPKQ